MTTDTFIEDIVVDHFRTVHEDTGYYRESEFGSTYAIVSAPLPIPGATGMSDTVWFKQSYITVSCYSRQRALARRLAADLTDSLTELTSGNEKIRSAVQVSSSDPLGPLDNEYFYSFIIKINHNYS